jgi:hypothetical protein
MRGCLFIALAISLLLMIIGCRETVESGHDWQQHADYFIGGTIIVEQDTANCDRTVFGHALPDSLVIAFNDSVYTMCVNGSWEIYLQDFDPFMISDNPAVAQLSVFDLNTWNLQEDPRDSFHVADTTWQVELNLVEEPYGDWYLGWYRDFPRVDFVRGKVYPQLWPDAPPPESP